MIDSGRNEARERGGTYVFNGFIVLVQGTLWASMWPNPFTYSVWGVGLLLMGFGAYLIVRSFRDETTTASDAEGLAGLLSELTENYRSQRRRLQRIFGTALVSFAIGIASIAIDVLGWSTLAGQSATVVGTVSTLLSGGLLAVYYRELAEAQRINEHLSRVYDLLTADQLSEDLPKREKNEAKQRIIAALTASTTNLPAVEDTSHDISTNTPTMKPTGNPVS